MKYNRIQQIENQIRIHKSMTNEELCAMFNISMQTLYRDLKILVDKGVIRKVYGGVVFNDLDISRTVPSLEVRRTSMEKEKIKLGQLAAELVEDNDIIFVDSGSTTVHIIPFLKDKDNITVVTHSLNVMEEIAKIPTIRGVMVGGKLNRRTMTFSANFNNIPFYYHKCFIAATGANLEALSNMDIDDGNIKKEVIEHSAESFLVVDHTKFKTTAFNIFARLDEMNGIICDDIPEDLEKILERKGVRIIKP